MFYTTFILNVSILLMKSFILFRLNNIDSGECKSQLCIEQKIVRLVESWQLSHCETSSATVDGPQIH